MRRVSLILPVASPVAIAPEYLRRCTDAFREQGFEVDPLVVYPSNSDSGEPKIGKGPSWFRANRRGLVDSMIRGLAGASGDVLLILDPTRGYVPEDLPLLVAPILEDEADLVVGRGLEQDADGNPGRFVTRCRDALVGRVARSVFGVSDVFSGLVALGPEVARCVAGTFDPVGSRFALDLLARSRSRTTEVRVRRDASGTAAAGFSLDDLRHLKRLADDRFGNASRLIQFCAVGATGMVVDLSCYAFFQLVFSRTSLAHRAAPWIGGTLDLAVAGALAIAIALTWNFSLNRRLTFNYARAGSRLRQFFKYALSNALGIALSLSLRLYLPAHLAFFHQHKLAAAVVGIVAATGVSFSLARWVVFSQQGVSRDQARAAEAAKAAGVVEV